MSVSVTEDIKSIEELASNARQVVEQIHRTGRPVVVTVDGRADIVMLDAAAYEQQLKPANLARLLALAAGEMARGETRPLEEFANELDRDGNVSS